MDQDEESSSNTRASDDRHKHDKTTCATRVQDVPDYASHMIDHE